MSIFFSKWRDIKIFAGSKPFHTVWPTGFKNLNNQSYEPRPNENGQNMFDRASGPASKLKKLLTITCLLGKRSMRWECVDRTSRPVIIILFTQHARLIATPTETEMTQTMRHGNNHSRHMTALPNLQYDNLPNGKICLFRVINIFVKSSKLSESNVKNKF